MKILPVRKKKNKKSDHSGDSDLKKKKKKRKVGSSVGGSRSVITETNIKYPRGVCLHSFIIEMKKISADFVTQIRICAGSNREDCVTFLIVNISCML